MIKITIRNSLPVFLLCLLVFSGCNSQGRPEGMPPLSPCQITVTQDDKPLEGATVQLYATGGDARWRPGGITDANGVANILVQGQFKGAPEGTYNVTVYKEEIVSLATPEQLAAIEKAKAENPKWYDPPKIKQEQWLLVEEKFTKKDTTPLEITVSKGKNNESFSVGGAVRVKLNEGNAEFAE